MGGTTVINISNMTNIPGVSIAGGIPVKGVRVPITRITGLSKLTMKSENDDWILVNPQTWDEYLVKKGDSFVFDLYSMNIDCLPLVAAKDVLSTVDLQIIQEA